MEKLKSILKKDYMKDVIIVALLVIVYSIISFIHLGSTVNPQTFGEFSQDTEVIFELEEESAVSRLRYFLGDKEGKFKVYGSTDNYIYNHLAGKDEFCRDVIGLYPLMEGNLCRFLAMDFDAHAPQGAKLNNFHSCKQCEALYAHAPKAQMSIISTHANGAIATYSHSSANQAVWKDDILAAHKTFSDFGINSYIEISRSGNGGHLWVFFDASISARNHSSIYFHIFIKSSSVTRVGKCNIKIFCCIFIYGSFIQRFITSIGCIE